MDLDDRFDPHEPEGAREEYVKPQLQRLGSLAGATRSTAGTDSDGIGPAPDPS